MIRNIIKEKETKTDFYFSNGVFYLDNELKEILKLDPENNLTKRLKYYFSWCEKNNCNFSFELLLFGEVESDIYIRKTSIENLGFAFHIQMKESLPFSQSAMGNQLSLFDHARDAIIITEAEPYDEPGPRIIYVNKAFEECSLYSSNDVLGRSPRLLQGDNTTKESRKNIREGLENWQNIRQVMNNYSKDGSPFQVELNISPVKDETGWWTHWLSIQRNITQEIEYHNKVRKVQETAKIGYWILSNNSMNLEFSDEARNIFGLIQEKTSFFNWFAKFDSLTQNLLNEKIRVAFEQSIPIDITLRLPSEGSKAKWLVMKAEPVLDNDNKVIQLFGTVQDVSELKSKEKDNEIILNSITEGYWDWWINDDYEYMSPRFWEMFGYDYRDKKHHPSEWQDLIHPDDAKKALRLFDEHIKSKGLKPYDLEVRYKHKNGEWIWVYCKGKVIEWNGDIAIRMVGSHTDITEHKRAQEEIERKTQESNLNSKLACIGEMAAGIGHEINNPLTIAFGNVQALKMISGATEKKLVSKLEVALDRIAKITKGMLSFARTQNNKTRISMGDIAIETIEFISEFYKKYKVDISFERNSHDDLILAVPSDIQQVITNLISNAKDALLDQKERKIRIKLKNDQEFVYFFVEDNGPGISEEHKEKIFESFFTTKDSGKGTGLGLSISYNIIARHGGELSVGDCDKGGACFSIKLPRYKSYMKKSNIRKVLVVDDEAEIQNFISQCLSELDLHVDFAGNGKDAFEMIKANCDDPYQVVFSDINMPEMNGFDLKEKVNGLHISCKPEFIFVTGAVSPKDLKLREMKDHEKYKVVMKPFVKSEIEDALFTIIQ